MVTRRSTLARFVVAIPRRPRRRRCRRCTTCMSGRLQQGGGGGPRLRRGGRRVGQVFVNTRRCPRLLGRRGHYSSEVRAGSQPARVRESAPERRGREHVLPKCMKRSFVGTGGVAVVAAAAEATAQAHRLPSGAPLALYPSFIMCTVRRNNSPLSPPQLTNPLRLSH